MYVVTFAAVVPICVKAPPAVERSILKPVSLDELSVQVRTSSAADALEAIAAPIRTAAAGMDFHKRRSVRRDVAEMAEGETNSMGVC